MASDLIVFSRKEAIDYLNVNEKHFDNYFRHSGEIKSSKRNNRWQFAKSDLDNWNTIRKNRTIDLSIKEYEECFEFAIKMAYSTRASTGTGIRGVRSEVQMADDFILGILAEIGIRKFLASKFACDIKLDLNIHQGKITAQDFDGILEKGKYRTCRIGVAVKSSKLKSCFNVIDPLEYENDARKSDIYIFIRVGLPSDHLFRILRNHSFFSTVRKFLEHQPTFRKIEKLNDIPIWICGYNHFKEFKKATEIPGLKFNGYRFIVSTADMHNSDNEWKDLISKL